MDRGPQLCGAIWHSFCATINGQHIPTTAYQPEGNSLVERLHRCLKDMLPACCSGLDWPNYLPWVLLALRTMTQEDDGFSPAQAVYGAPLTLPADRQDALNPELPLEQELQTQRVTPNTATPATMCNNTTAGTAQLETILDALRNVELAYWSAAIPTPPSLH